ncbi:hypothetical protein [Parasitella parasitica]|uniref:Kinetochore protein Spc24 n=1 Tax=Parasitella parasitica TaxID=35722 RepID=A0A0B7N6A0_9FUNG|nr:hypothetical protein [Parasitella parasitica]
MFKLVSNPSIIQEIEQAIRKALNQNPLDELNRVKQTRLESESKLEKITQAKEDEIEELQKESDTLLLKESTVTKNYKALNEEHVLSEAELQKLATLQSIELEAIEELNKEIQLQESQLVELESPETSLEAVSPDELRLGLYRGLGISSQIINDKIETVVLTTADKQDIRSMGLSYEVDYLSNQCWDFLSK